MIVDSAFRFNLQAVPQFAYRARNAQGGLVEGVLNCADRSMAIRQIEQLHYIPIRIDAAGVEPQAVTATVTQPATQSLKIPHAQLTLINGAGHHVMIEQPAAVNRALMEFVSRM